jgi:hypothetical protein
MKIAPHPNPSPPLASLAGGGKLEALLPSPRAAAGRETGVLFSLPTRGGGEGRTPQASGVGGVRLRSSFQVRGDLKNGHAPSPGEGRGW